MSTDQKLDMLIHAVEGIEQKMATKEMLNELEQKMATKEMLNELEQKMATKEMLNELEQKMATKEMLKAERRDIENTILAEVDRVQEFAIAMHAETNKRLTRVEGQMQTCIRMMDSIGILSDRVGVIEKDIEILKRKSS